jgi:hypothetical protein
MRLILHGDQVGCCRGSGQFNRGEREAIILQRIQCIDGIYSVVLYKVYHVSQSVGHIVRARGETKRAWLRETGALAMFQRLRCDGW